MYKINKLFLKIIFILIFPVVISATDFNGVCVGINDYPAQNLLFYTNAEPGLASIRNAFYHWTMICQNSAGPASGILIIKQNLFF